MTLENRARRSAAELRDAGRGDPPSIEDVVRRRDRRRTRRVAGALTTLAVLVFAAAVVVDRDPGPERAVVAGPGTHRAVDPVPTSTTAAPQTTTESAVASRPTSFLAVRENGDLVHVEDGVTKVLANEDFDEDEGPDYGIDAIALDHDRDRAYFSVCCEPASGSLHSIRLDGRGRRPVNDGGGGYYPTVSPDGRSLALGLYRGIGIIDLTTGSMRQIESEEFLGGSLRPAWSPDGATLAVEYGIGRDRAVFVMRSDASSFDDVRRITPAGRHWSLPAFRRDGRLLVVEQCCGFEPTGPARGVVVDPATGAEIASIPYEATVRDQSYDATGTYLLYVTTDGVLRWRGAGQADELGKGYRAAVW